ncbi:hypothetical protein [Roseivirga pacifica]|uniref:Cbp1 family collagen-binding glycoprotein adhesin n=1 Tax=Roseivirga pacifica TaxID=1267423 RepID=UPI00227C7665|nr:hypothetical protein [Roseivirga pacifica]
MKQTMKVGMVLLGALTIAMWFGMSSINKKKEALSANIEQLERKSLQKELVYEEMIGLIDEVEGQLDEIVTRESLIYGQRTEAFQGDQKTKMLKEIGAIDELIVRSNENIISLNDKIKSSDLKLGVFQKRINALQADLTDRVTQITGLKEELVAKDEALAFLMNQTDSLNQSIDQYVADLGQKRLEITQLTASNNELNKGYLAIGTFQDLKTKGVVDKEGGFLGLLGRKVALQEDAEITEFMTIDKREINRIPVAATGLALISEHPSNSYRILPGANETEKVLEIVDPEAFWQISKYLVISKKS